MEKDKRRVSYVWFRIKKGKLIMRRCEDVLVNTPPPVCERIRKRLSEKNEIEVRDRAAAREYLRELFCDEED